MNYISSGASSNQASGIFMTEWFIWTSGILGSIAENHMSDKYIDIDEQL